MQTQEECIPCLERHANELAQENLPDHERATFLQAVQSRLARFDFTNAPPVFAMEMYGVLQELTGITDPYAEHKKLYNRKALDLYPRLRQIAAGSADPLDAGLRIAVAGNVIDFSIEAGDGIEIEKTVHRALDARFVFDDTNELKERLKSSENILYIADNAGEIVLDKLFIELIGQGRVTCAVRSAPIINDATAYDASQAGLQDVCRVIESGSKTSGTLLDLCSSTFRDLFFSADVVISKGQGNFETLAEAGRDVFHLMMVKCPVISSEVGAPMGSFIAMKVS